MNCTNKECFPIPLSPAPTNTKDNISGTNSVWRYFYDYGFNQNLSDFAFESFYPSNGSCESENGGIWIQIPGIGLGNNVYPNIPALLDALQALGVDCNGLTAQQCSVQANNILGYSMTTAGIGAGACIDCPTCGEEENICDNFESSIPVSTNAFCAKCETNSWVGSGYEQYCECCPKTNTTFIDPGKAPFKEKPKKLRNPKRELRENFIHRLQKLAGIKKQKK
tara:strand:+ start:20 stop:688 length:669 start_codon:yes stop_codon:yes gene_type:complete